MAPPKGAKLKQIPVDVKLQVVRRANSGESLHSLSKETSFSRWQIRQWIANAGELKSLVNKRQRNRKSGAGKKAHFPELERAVFEWFKTQRAKKFTINYPAVRRIAKAKAEEMKISASAFPCSDKWIRGFCKRHGIGSRRITHQGQQDSRTLSEKYRLVRDFLASIPDFTTPYSADCIFNMDETPAYFDMASETTLDFRGAKNVEGTDTGHRHSRFTVVLCISASGRIIKTLIIFKGLKKVPKITLPKNIHVAVSMGGSMNTPILKEWIRVCFCSRGNYLQRKRSLLFWDSYGTHLKPEIEADLKNVCNTEAAVIPAKTTSLLQPLDVAMNQPFKAAMRENWNAWLQSGPQETTAKGYRKRPSYQAIIDMVNLSLDSLSQEAIKKSFCCCGIAEKGQEVTKEELHTRLKDLLDNGEEEERSGSAGKARVSFEEEDREEGDSGGDEVEGEELVAQQEGGEEISSEELSEEESDVEVEVD